MAKTISVDELTYSNLVAVTGKMMIAFGKPLSLGFTIYIATQALDMVFGKLTKKDIQELRETLKDLPSEEFDRMMEERFKAIVGEKRKEA